MCPSHPTMKKEVQGFSLSFCKPVLAAAVQTMGTDGLSWAFPVPGVSSVSFCSLCLSKPSSWALFSK